MNSASSGVPKLGTAGCLKVRGVTSRAVATLTGDAAVEDAVNVLFEKCVNAVVVTDRERRCAAPTASFVALFPSASGVEMP